MAAKNQQGDKPEKRKHITSSKTDTDKFASKKPKLGGSKPSIPPNKGSQKPFKVQKHGNASKPVFNKSESGKENVPATKRELRLKAKEVTEARKKKRKRHYTLEQELASLWEKMRRRNITKGDRSKLVTEALERMKGKISEIAGSHVSSRVLQTCVKHCKQEERDAVFEELQPHFLTLACNTYAVHLVTKLLDNASKNQLAGFLSLLHGHVAALLRHMVGSVVIEHAYQLANASQKQELLMELYSTEFKLSKDFVSSKESRLVDVISKPGVKKSSVLRHVALAIQPILEKGIVDHSILHKVIMEYFSIAGEPSATELIQQLCGPLLVRMIHTKDGARVGMLCVKHGNAKERKKIIKGMKGLISKIAHEQYGSMVLVSIVSIVDDTKLIKKTVIREVQPIVKKLALDKSGRRLLLQLLHPNSSRYLSPDDLASLNLSIPSLCTKAAAEANSETKSLKDEDSDEAAKVDNEETQVEADKNTSTGENLHSVDGGKKDPFLRRKELLVDSGLAESLVDVCIESTEELLRSHFGKDVVYEVAIGGADGILHPTLDDKLNVLHETVASLVAEPKSAEKEHMLENFHSNRTIRKLILDCPTFATTLWKSALEGKCEIWAQGHSAKVIYAFMETSDSKIRDMAKDELQPLIDNGVLKIPETKQPGKEI